MNPSTHIRPQEPTAREAPADRSPLRLGSAPCSWGIIENTQGVRIGYAQMLDELAETGYTGTELGDWGYMPTDPGLLRDELAQRGLSMIGSWVTVRFHDEAFHDAGVRHALEVARLLAEVSGSSCTVNLGGDHSTVLSRAQNAGRIGPAHGLSMDAWKIYVRGVHRVAEAVREETGLRCCFHPHGATFVETPQEIEWFLERTDPGLVELVLDTGHCMLGGGDPATMLDSYRERVGLVHFKDFEPSVLQKAARNSWTYKEMVGAGLFPELGKGGVDFPSVVRLLQEMGYAGWIVVEQDVLPGMGTPRESSLHNRTYLRSLGL